MSVYWPGKERGAPEPRRPVDPSDPRNQRPGESFDDYIRRRSQETADQIPGLLGGWKGNWDTPQGRPMPSVPMPPGGYPRPPIEEALAILAGGIGMPQGGGPWHDFPMRPGEIRGSDYRGLPVDDMLLPQPPWQVPRAGRPPIPGQPGSGPLPPVTGQRIDYGPIARPAYTAEEQDFLRRNPGDEHRLGAAFGKPRGR